MRLLVMRPVHVRSPADNKQGQNAVWASGHLLVEHVCHIMLGHATKHIHLHVQ